MQFFQKDFSHLGFCHRHREQLIPNLFQKLKISNKIIDFSVLDFDLFLCFLDFGLSEKWSTFFCIFETDGDIKLVVTKSGEISQYLHQF